MPYKVQFIGLAWFHWEAQGQMRVLLPDGRNFPNVPSHKFSISIAPDAVLAQTGWAADQIESDQYQTQFWVPPSKITIDGVNGDGFVDASKQIPRLPSLRAIEPKAKFDPERAHRVGDLSMQRGTFEAFRMPGQDPNNCGLITALDVPYDGDITITLTELPDPLNPVAPGPVPVVRTIVLKAGTEIAFVNASRGVAHAAGDGDHFNIYSRLSYESVQLISPAIASANIPVSPSQHPFLTTPNPFVNGPGCSNATI